MEYFQYGYSNASTNHNASKINLVMLVSNTAAAV